MELMEVLQRCCVYQNNCAVTVLEPGKRRITFFKNSRRYEEEALSGGKLDGVKVAGLGEAVCECFGILGMVKFTEGPYLLAITEAVRCGCILGIHDVYAVRRKVLVPLYRPRSTSDVEANYRDLFNQFDISNKFYFSYTYNLANSLQANLTYRRCTEEDGRWLPFDPGVVTQKFRYNAVHARRLADHFGAATEGLCLHVIHGYFGQATVSLSGRSVTMQLIARRSRFYAGTRYKKRGITADGHVANDVETEQILADDSCTGSVYAFVQVRGSTPTFWEQDAKQAIMKKPPLTYPQHDPTFTASRLHVAELFGLYGAPLIMLNLLSDDPATAEGQLSARYESVVKALNAELPTGLRLQYMHLNLRSALERGNMRKMVAEVIEHAAGELDYLHWRGDKALKFQTGVLRTSCLDCLDRTSVVTMQLGLLMFQRQLAELGIHVRKAEDQDVDVRIAPDLTPSYSEEFGIRRSHEPIIDLFKDMFESLSDELSMQYAGSRTLRKYEGLLTTLKRRYSSHFADSDRQTLSNVFLGVLKPGRHPPPWVADVDRYIHQERFRCEYANLEWWVLPATCYLRRVRKLEVGMRRPWFDMFDASGEYLPWLLMAQLMVRHGKSAIGGVCLFDGSDCGDTEEEVTVVARALRPGFSMGAWPHMATEGQDEQYVGFESRYRGNVVHITRCDPDDDAVGNTARPTRADGPLAWTLHQEASAATSRGAVGTLLSIRKPNLKRIVGSLEPWRTGLEVIHVGEVVALGRRGREDARVLVGHGEQADGLEDAGDQNLPRSVVDADAGLVALQHQQPNQVVELRRELLQIREVVGDCDQELAYVGLDQLHKVTARLGVTYPVRKRNGADMVVESVQKMGFVLDELRFQLRDFLKTSEK
ncbi:inositol 5-phosphatase, putative [Babesia caballi]|uniref:Inositol 5-phosphatase, putative n=1 Tax=Babesia caballi TaxID=5871 RepID=A0AAV4LS33_BABCB|nr:inositol 5-phosphatase, putative [Babesia caballi]